ncbi:uncharacterized protein I303_100045 [Kwoniella dejecticola CBS 10117]|uniref:Uncharacterized protein n=1 Tax=Kwoniella dejecticola CBS 10117 TaxID=1296121 RepID=A0A1A6ADW7_9TREE|nr:uncharacterized protein I303_00045 [Kwoniella dejecticola CBS 10117]OBR88234.1 hypothetical protein I303_00045 [Kwoniella dejecticola CBS 10117]
MPHIPHIHSDPASAPFNQYSSSKRITLAKALLQIQRWDLSHDDRRDAFIEIGHALLAEKQEQHALGRRRKSLLRGYAISEGYGLPAARRDLIGMRRSFEGYRSPPTMSTHDLLHEWKQTSSSDCSASRWNRRISLLEKELKELRLGNNNLREDISMLEGIDRLSKPGDERAVKERAWPSEEKRKWRRCVARLRRLRGIRESIRHDNRHYIVYAGEEDEVSSLSSITIGYSGMR